jgi:methylated-DNA-protein-cysteine methyltransferase-like protein
MQDKARFVPFKLDDTFVERVYEQVSKVPYGSVCTYGTIAELAGYPKAAREVGRVMSRVPRELKLPCHRIVNAKGTLAPDYAFGGQEKQRELLEAEGITFIGEDTINMKQHVWPPKDEPEQLTLGFPDA